MEAQGGDINRIFPGGLQDGLTFLRLDLRLIDG
jgi:hypothetical protein